MEGCGDERGIVSGFGGVGVLLLADSVSLGPSGAERLIVALDTPDIELAQRIVDRLGDRCSLYKIGLQLVFAGGIRLARRLNGQGKQVLLDLKLSDIPSTVKRATEGLLKLVNPDFLTVSSDLRSLEAAVKVCRDADAPTKVLFVNLLTSLEQENLEISGFEFPLEQYVVERSKQAAAAGAAGVIASGIESRSIRAACTGYPQLLIVSPGIRLPHGDPHEHQRCSTPAEAIRAGSDYLVVGRPIIGAPDPLRAFRLFADEIAAA